MSVPEPTETTPPTPADAPPPPAATPPPAAPPAPAPEPDRKPERDWEKSYKGQSTALNEITASRDAAQAALGEATTMLQGVQTTLTTREKELATATASVTERDTQLASKEEEITKLTAELEHSKILNEPEFANLSSLPETALSRPDLDAENYRTYLAALAKGIGQAVSSGTEQQLQGAVPPSGVSTETTQPDPDSIYDELMGMAEGRIPMDTARYAVLQEQHDKLTR